VPRPRLSLRKSSANHASADRRGSRALTIRGNQASPPQQSVSHICRPTFGELAFLCPDAIKENNMALTITATVSKKVGKPNYGSEGFTLTVQSEVSNMDQVQEESHRLYLLLNESVNQELSGSTTGMPSRMTSSTTATTILISLGLSGRHTAAFS